MTQPEKDEVLKTPEQANPGSGSSPSSFGANATSNTRPAGGPTGSSAGGAQGASGTQSAQGAGAQNAQGNNAANAGHHDQSGEVLTPDVIENGAGAPASDKAEESVDDQVAKARAEAQEWQDKFVRLHAEWDTYRRRTAEQRQEERANATEKLVASLLPVIDDFERTIDYAEKNGEKGLLDGVKAVGTKLVDTLRKEGVEVLDPKGQAFDALECQAIGTCEDKEVPDETVADVYQKGYKMGKKVLRPAMVTVATGGPKREVEKDSEQ